MNMEHGEVQKRSLLSAEAIAENEDLLTEILLRVPARPLIRFQCVSKRWLSMISALDFRRRHTLRHPTPKVSAVFLRRIHLGLQFLSLAAANPSLTPFKIPKFFHDPLFVLQSCNGLLLCSTLGEQDKTQFHRNYFLYNPTTNRFRVLPLLEKSVTVLGMNLAFDPTRSPYYTVVCVQTTVQSSYYYQIMVYGSNNSNSSEAWRPCGSPFVAPHDMRFGRGVYWNGAIHWFSFGGVSLCFDLARECFVNMPSLPRIGGFVVAAVSCGHLHLVETPPTCFNAELRVFRLERDCSCFVEYRVEIATLAAAFPQMVRGCRGHAHGGLGSSSSCYAFMVLSVVALGGYSEEGDSSLLLHVPVKVIAYNLEEKTFREICDLSPQRSLQFGWSGAYDYVETFACV